MPYLLKPLHMKQLINLSLLIVAATLFAAQGKPLNRKSKVHPSINAARLDTTNYPVYATSDSTINAAINSLYASFSESVTAKMAVIDNTQSLTGANSTITTYESTGSTVAAAADSSILYTRGASASDAGFGGVKWTFTTPVDVSADSVFDINIKMGSVTPNYQINAILKLTDNDGTIVYLRTLCPTRFYNKYVILSFDKRYISAYSGGTGKMDYTQVKSVSLAFETKISGWKVNVKILRGSAWLPLSKNLVDTYGFNVAGNNYATGYYVDFPSAKIRFDATSSIYTSGTAYTVNYSYGGGTVVIPRGFHNTGMQILVRSNLKLTGYSKYADRIQWIPYSAMPNALMDSTGVAIVYTRGAVISNLDTTNGCYHVQIENIGIDGQQNVYEQAHSSNITDGVTFMVKSAAPIVSPYFSINNITIKDCYFRNITRSVIINNIQRNVAQAWGIRFKDLDLEDHYNNGWEVYNCFEPIIDGIILNGSVYRSLINAQSAVGNVSVFTYGGQISHIVSVNTGLGLFIKDGTQGINFQNFSITCATGGLSIGEEPGATTNGTIFMNNTISNGSFFSNTQETQNAMINFMGGNIGNNTQYRNFSINNVNVIGGWNAVYGGNPSMAIVVDNTQFNNCKFYNQRANSFDWQNSYQTNTLIKDCSFFDANLLLSAGTYRVINCRQFNTNTTGTFMTVSGGTPMEIAGNYSKGPGSSVGLNITGTTAGYVHDNTFTNYTYGIQLVAGTTGGIFANNNLAGNITNGINVSTSTGNKYYLNQGYNTTAQGHLYADGSIDATNYVAAFARTTVADVNYTAAQTDYLISYTSLTAARTVTLIALTGATAALPKFQEVKDESGNAGTFNITINAPAGKTIDGAASKVINSGYGLLKIYYNGTNFFTGY